MILFNIANYKINKLLFFFCLSYFLSFLYQRYTVFVIYKHNIIFAKFSKKLKIGNIVRYISYIFQSNYLIFKGDSNYANAFYLNDLAIYSYKIKKNHF